MHWVLIRHAKAEDKTVFALTGRPDGERPLVPEGRKKMRKNARGLVQAVPGLDRVLSSPYRRALETAEIVAAAYGVEVEAIEELRPATAPADLAARLSGQVLRRCVALVGHEPDLGRLAAWSLTGGSADFAPMKKGAAMLLETDGPLAEGSARLVWSLTPGLLRRLG